MITMRFSFVFFLNVKIFQRKTAAHDSTRELPAVPVPCRQHSAARAPLHMNLTVGAQALQEQVRAEIYSDAASLKHAHSQPLDACLDIDKRCITCLSHQHW